MAIWHNGQLQKSALCDATSAGLLLGWGVFTTVGVHEGRPLWLDRHLARLRRDAARCDVELPFPDEHLSEGLYAVLNAQKVRNGLARLTVTRHDDGRWNTQPGTDCSIIAHETPSPPMRDLKVTFAPSPSLGDLAGVKTTSYLPYFWNWRQASAQGFDEVILFDHAERALEAARSSLFWVIRGQIQTTPLDMGPLAGVGREVVLAWAREQGIEIKECSVRCKELVWCDEVFLVSAATGPRAIRTFHREGKTQHLSGEPQLCERLRSWWNPQS